MTRIAIIACALAAGVIAGSATLGGPGTRAAGTQTSACVPATAPNTWPPGPVLATRDHFAGHAEPALAVNPRYPRNVLGAAQFAFRTTFRRVPGTFYSADGGRTWHDNNPLPLPPGYDHGDDVSAVFAGGTGLVAAEIYPADGNGSGVFAWRTTDGGRHFSAPVPVYLAPAGAPHTDHPWLTAVTGPAGRPVVAVAWSEQGSLLFSRSTDGGRVFSPPRTISAPGDQYPDYAVVTPGPGQELSVVYAATTASRTAVIKVTTSRDAGQTFSAPATVPGTLVTAGAQPYEVSLIGASTDPRTGAPYVAFAEETGQPARLRVVITHASADGHWTTPAQVDLAAGGPNADQFQPSVAVGRDGRVYVTYFVAHGGEVAAFLTETGGRSRTWRLGRPFDAACGLTMKERSPWLGDYQALASGAGHTYAAWNDGGTGRLQIVVQRIGALQHQRTRLPTRRVLMNSRTLHRRPVASGCLNVRSRL
jgi:hypothetical protein